MGMPLSISAEGWDTIYWGVLGLPRKKIVRALRNNGFRGHVKDIPTDTLAEELIRCIEWIRECSLDFSEVYLDKKGKERVSWAELERLAEEQRY